MSRRVLVCGGRDFNNEEILNRILTALHHAKPITAIIHGESGKRDKDGKVICGADLLAEQWAKKWKVEVRSFKADWTKHGNAAGPIRNQQMLDEGKPDLVVAFQGGKGTADMCRKARKAGVIVLKIRNKPFDPDISM